MPRPTCAGHVKHRRRGTTVKYGQTSFPMDRKEVLDMALSLAALSLGFSLLYGKGLGLAAVLALLPVMAVILLLAFLGHELAHRYVANRLGYFARYEASYPWLALAVVLPALTNFIFAAPGAVVVSQYNIWGRASPRDFFYISAAGPATNIGLALLSLPLVHVVPMAWYFAKINAWLALFNLLPIPPLDGYKMFRVYPAYWAIALAAAAALFLLI